jgi:peptidoglycan/LPS O-acetylase OafA/YrhL
MIIVLYLMTPFLRLAMRDRTVGLWTGGLILALFLVHAVFPDIPFIKAIYFEDVRFLLSFVGGFLLVRHLEGKRWLGPVSLSVAILFYGIQLAVKIWHPLEFPFYVFTAFGLFGWMISWKPRKPRKVVTFLSETSYGIYLCHAAIISVFVRFAEPYLPVLASPLITGTFTLAASATLMWLCKKCKLNKILY